MYRNDDYLALAHLGATELRDEMRKALEAIDYYQAYANKPINRMGTLPPLQPIIEKIKSCENYIIEIERRLGHYSRNVSRLMIKLRNKKIQSIGVNPTPVAATRPIKLPAKMSASSKKRAKINVTQRRQINDLEWVFD